MMGKEIREALTPVCVIIFVAALGFLAVRLLAGCASRAEGPTLPRFCTEEALYTAALLRCVDNAHTLAESQMCRQNVDYACGIRQTTRAK